MKIRLLASALLFGLLVPALNLFADQVSGPDSAWSTVPARPDPKLRDPLLRRGQEVFRARCLICHGPIPKQVVPGGIPPMPGTQALQAKYHGTKPALLELRTDLTPAFITAIVRHGINSMPFFRPTEITNADLKAVGAYLSRKRK